MLSQFCLGKAKLLLWERCVSNLIFVSLSGLGTKLKLSSLLKHSSLPSL